MPLFTVDHNNVFGKYVEEAGRYNVKIVRADMHHSKQGNDYITVDYEVQDGKYKGGQIRYQNITWSNEDLDGSIKRFNTFAVALGASDGTSFDSVGQFAASILNKLLTIDVDWDEPNTNGKVYLTVKGYHKLLNEPSQPNGVRRPDASSAQQSSNVTPFTKPSQQTATDPFAGGSGKPVNISDDDLPF